MGPKRPRERLESSRAEKGQEDVVKVHREPDRALNEEMAQVNRMKEGRGYCIGGAWLGGPIPAHVQLECVYREEAQ